MNKPPSLSETIMPYDNTGHVTQSILPGGITTVSPLEMTGTALIFRCSILCPLLIGWNMWVAGRCLYTQ